MQKQEMCSIVVEMQVVRRVQANWSGEGWEVSWKRWVLSFCSVSGINQMELLWYLLPKNFECLCDLKYTLGQPRIEAHGFPETEACVCINRVRHGMCSRKKWLINGTWIYQHTRIENELCSQLMSCVEFLYIYILVFFVERVTNAQQSAMCPPPRLLLTDNFSKAVIQRIHLESRPGPPAHSPISSFCYSEEC